MVLIGLCGHEVGALLGAPKERVPGVGGSHASVLVLAPAEMARAVEGNPKAKTGVQSLGWHPLLAPPWNEGNRSPPVHLSAGVLRRPAEVLTGVLLVEMALRTRWLEEVLGGAVLVDENAVPVLVEMVGSPVASVREVLAGDVLRNLTRY